MKKLIVAAGMLAGASAFAAVYNVSPDAGEWTAGSLIDAANNKATKPGDVIHLACGTYKFNTANGGELIVKSGVTIIGGSDDPANTVIERVKSGNNDRVINLGRNATARNLTFRGGYTVYQAACVLGYDSGVHKVFSVSNCIVENGSALYKGGGSAGGVWRDCVIRNCTVRNPASDSAKMEGSGGGIWGGTLYNCVITNNTACYAGGGIAGNATDPCVAYGCTIAYNTAPFGSGAGTDSTPERCRLYDCNVVSNDGHNASGQAWGGKGGGIYNCWVTNSLIAWNKTRTDNGKGIGGGAGVWRGKVYNSIIKGNYTTKYGNYYTVDGGGAEAAYLENCQIVDNTSVRYAGGTLSCTNVNCYIAGNSGTGGGGTFQGLNVNCVITNNTATVIQGGGCYNSDTINCRIVGNTTTTFGAVCRGHHQGDLIAYNTCKNNGEGGSGLQPQSGSAGDCWAINCTVYGNTGGTCQAYASHVTNCIVSSASGTDVDACEMVNCFYGTKTARSTALTDCVQGSDAGFVGAAAKAGEDFFSLRRSSPCVDAGLNFAWMKDAQDLLGNPRLHMNRVDIGAFENATKGISIFVR